MLGAAAAVEVLLPLPCIVVVVAVVRVNLPAKYDPAVSLEPSLQEENDDMQELSLLALHCYAVHPIYRCGTEATRPCVECRPV